MSAMPDPLSAEALARMKAEHVDDGDGSCEGCPVTTNRCGDMYSVKWPCDAALLLAELERYAGLNPLPPITRLEYPVRSIHLQGDIGRALCGPSTTEDLR